MTDRAGGEMSGIHRVAMEIATRRAQDLRAIKEALLADDEALALRLMRAFFELPQKNRKAR